MPAARRVSLQQVEMLLAFLEEHLEMAKGQAFDNPQARAAVRDLWEELAARLNALGTGIHKNHTEWRDYWRDMKYRVKKKAGEIEVDRRRTGGGPAGHVPLNETDQRVYAIIGTRAVLGDEAVRIPFDPELPQPASNPPSPVYDVEILPADENLPPFRPESPQPSSSRGPPVYGGSPSAEGASPAPKRKKKSIAPGQASTVEIPQPRWDRPVSPQPSSSCVPPVCAGSLSAEGASPAPKRKRKSSAPGQASTVEIPQPRWAWEAEQRRLALDERRLRVEEQLSDSIAAISRSITLMVETFVSIRDEIRQLRESLQ